jgi:hypothetical protein
MCGCVIFLDESHIHSHYLNCKIMTDFVHCTVMNLLCPRSRNFRFFIVAITAHHTPNSCHLTAPPVPRVSLGSSVDQRLLS